MQGVQMFWGQQAVLEKTGGYTWHCRIEFNVAIIAEGEGVMGTVQVYVMFPTK